MKTSPFIVKICLILNLLMSPHCYANDTKQIQLNTWALPPLSNKNQSGFLDQLVVEAFRRINYEVTIEHRPVERSIQEANKGMVDGEFIRVPGMSKIYPNLVQVPIELFEFEFVAFSQMRDLKLQNWNDLNQYYVGIVVGWKILEKNVPDTERRYSLANRHILFKMLYSGRIDIAVYSRFAGIEVIKELDYQGLYVIEPPLAQKKMYLYLHKKHADLVPRLHQVIEEMYADGTYARLLKTMNEQVK